MIKGCQDFYYGVKDMDQAVKFYQDAFGMKKTYGDEHWTNMVVNRYNLEACATFSDIPEAR
jgi:predicted enzyme related to lactoylglutathione lyase